MNDIGQESVTACDGIAYVVEQRYALDEVRQQWPNLARVMERGRIEAMLTLRRPKGHRLYQAWQRGQNIFVYAKFGSVGGTEEP